MTFNAAVARNLSISPAAVRAMLARAKRRSAALKAPRTPRIGNRRCGDRAHPREYRADRAPARSAPAGVPPGAGEAGTRNHAAGRPEAPGLRARRAARRDAADDRGRVVTHNVTVWRSVFFMLTPGVVDGGGLRGQCAVSTPTGSPWPVKSGARPRH